MQPLRFGAPDRQLAGIYHPPAGGRAAVASVLLCNPFGVEAIRAHRLMRLLAEGLARKGHAVLRFDYRGTGDADGDDEDTDLTNWVDDIRSAHAELARRALTRRIVWLGARLGAAAAALAFADAPWPPRRIVLWEPVFDGAAYLADLRDEHRCFVRDNRLPDVALANGTADLLGFAVSQRFQSELAGIGNRIRAAAPDCEVVLVSRPDAAYVGNVAAEWERRGTLLRHVALDLEMNWTSEEAMNTALAPASAVATLATAVEAPGA